MEAVGGDRRGVDETLRAGRGRGPERVERALDVDRADRLARRRAAGDHEREVHDDVGAAERLLRARPAARTSPWRYSIFVQPCSAGSKGRRAMPTMPPIRASACSSGISPKPKVPVGPVTATVSGAADAAIRERDPIVRAAAPAPATSMCATTRRRRLQRGVRV